MHSFTLFCTGTKEKKVSAAWKKNLVWKESNFSMYVASASLAISLSLSFFLFFTIDFVWFHFIRTAIPGVSLHITIEPLSHTHTYTRLNFIWPKEYIVYTHQVKQLLRLHCRKRERERERKNDSSTHPLTQTVNIQIRIINLTYDSLLRKLQIQL